MRFVDTNVLIYAVSTAPDEAAKAELALGLLRERDLALSVQVLQEFYVQATRPSRPGALTHGEAVAFAASLRRFRIQDNTVEIVEAAFAIRERFGLSYWDSAILAAARASGCAIVYSEDLSAEQDYGGLRVINPFQSLPKA
jgi:predicted nucleic acid-binding protein